MSHVIVYLPCNAVTLFQRCKIYLVVLISLHGFVFFYKLGGKFFWIVTSIYEHLCQLFVQNAAAWNCEAYQKKSDKREDVFSQSEYICKYAYEC